MKAFKSLQVVVRFTDGECIFSDLVTRGTILSEMQAKYPRDTMDNLEKNLDAYVDELMGTLSSINSLSRLNVTVEGSMVAVNPTLVKTLTFKVDR